MRVLSTADGWLPQDGGGIYLRSAASQMKQVKCTSNTASKVRAYSTARPNPPCVVSARFAPAAGCAARQPTATVTDGYRATATRQGGGGMYMINDGNTRADIVSSRFDGNVASVRSPSPRVQPSSHVRRPLGWGAELHADCGGRGRRTC